MQAQWERQLLDLAGRIPHPSTRPMFSYWAGNAELRKSYAVCNAITARHSKSFFMASGLLPEEKRYAVRALYAFCRTVDDIVDLQGESGREDRLDYWKKIIRSSKTDSEDPVASAWVDTINRYHIPRHYAMQLIDGVSRDLTQSRYATFDELAMYCYGVASTVGLMSMYIIGFKTTEAVQYAIRLGVALQMTNILRDVGEDHLNGRIYLPQDEFQIFGISEDDIAAGKVTKKWRSFMRYQIERTRKLYADSWAGISMLEREGQLAIAAASELYAGILDEIEANDFNVFTQRAGLSTLQKLGRIPGLWWKVQRI